MIRIRTRKIFIYSIATLIALMILLILVISPLAKYLLEKHGRELFGRELKMDWAYVNPFTGYAHLGHPRLYEEQGDSVFLSVDGVSGTISRLRLFSRIVEINHLTFDTPNGKIVQNKKDLNIRAVIEKFKPNKTNPNPSPWSVDVTSLTINQGEFHYIDKVIPINYFIKNLDLKSRGRLSQGDTLAANFSFLAGIGTGKMKGDFTINTKTNDYRFAVNIHDFDMEIIRQYIWELINYGMFRAHLDADLKARGNFNSQDSISAQGRFALRDFHLGKTERDDYASFKKLVIGIQELSPYKRKYLFDSVLLSSPFVKYELYDSLDNIERLFGKKGSNISDITQQPGRFNLVIEIARYVKVITRNFFQSDYKINRLEVDHGDFQYNDFSLSEKFSVDAAPLHILADSVNKSDRRVEVLIDTGIKPYGSGSMRLSINPRDSGDFDMHYRFKKIPASLFNPYLITKTSFPFDRGTVELTGTWKVRNGIIKSDNHLLVVDPRVAARIRNKDVNRLPMPLIMALVREEGNVIDYEIPITGNLKRPKFHLRDVVFDVVKNIFVKPPTTLYREEVKENETEIEKTLTVKWGTRQQSLNPDQEKFVSRLSDFLKSNTDASITAYPVTYAEREKEHILFFETKKKYFIQRHHMDGKSLTEKDSLEVEKMSVKDPMLVEVLSKGLSDTVMFTIHEKCLNFIGARIVSDRFDRLVKARDRLFLSYFEKNGTAGQVRFRAGVNEIPYNGFSYLRLNYEKDIPPTLQRAYRKMTEFNRTGPRKKYIRYRGEPQAAASADMPL